MTRAIDLPENQVRAIIRAARKEGARVEVKIGSAIITVFPDDHAQEERPMDAAPTPETFETLDDYFAWRDRNRAREDQGNS